MILKIKFRPIYFHRWEQWNDDRLRTLTLEVIDPKKKDDEVEKNVIKHLDRTEPRIDSATSRCLVGFSGGVESMVIGPICLIRWALLFLFTTSAAALTWFSSVLASSPSSLLFSSSTSSSTSSSASSSASTASSLLLFWTEIFYKKTEFTTKFSLT